jgi:tripartite-type tricarboxylate transporter receptor subunit TctC
MVMRRLITLLTCIVALGASGATWGQNWPQKPVRLINPFPPGGGTDTFARPLAARLSQAMGQQFIVENMGGAGGTLGAARAAKEAPDGYTFLIGAVHHTIAETLYTKLPYHLERDFIPITVIATVPNVIVVNPKRNFKSLAELIAFAKANPGKLNYGSAGNGTTHHLAGELFKQVTGTELTHVPYKGAGPLTQDLLAGQVDLAFDGLGSSASHIKSGRLRPLAVTTPARSALLPDVPTAGEAGVKGYELTTWYAVWAVKGTPQPIVDRMYQEIAKALQSPEIKLVWDGQGAALGGMPPAEFAALVKQEIARWGKVVKDANIKIDL